MIVDNLSARNIFTLTLTLSTGTFSYAVVVIFASVKSIDPKQNTCSEKVFKFFNTDSSYQVQLGSCKSAQNFFKIRAGTCILWVCQFLMKNIFWMKVPLEIIHFYIIILSKVKTNFLRLRLAWEKVTIRQCSGTGVKVPVKLVLLGPGPAIHGKI
jgi:hypothetical protein